MNLPLSADLLRNPEDRRRFLEKCAKVALVACMRILAIRLNAMIRDGTDWRIQPA